MDGDILVKAEKIQKKSLHLSECSHSGRKRKGKIKGTETWSELGIESRKSTIQKVKGRENSRRRMSVEWVTDSRERERNVRYKECGVIDDPLGSTLISIVRAKAGR